MTQGNLKLLIQNRCISNIEKAMAEENQLFAQKIILHFSHCNRRYEATWKGEDEIVIATAVTPDDPKDFLYGIEDHRIGSVRLERDPSWSNDTFITVAKIAVNAFLDGLRSGSELF